MAEAIGALRVDLAANVAQFQADMGRVSAIVNSASNRMRTSMTAFGTGLAAATREIFNLRNAMVVVAAGALVAFAKRALDAADSIVDTADKIGISTDRLQELRYAALLSGAKVEDLDRSLLQLAQRLGGAQGEVDEVARGLGKLGISIASVKGQRADQLFELIAERIRTIRDPLVQANIAYELFGRTGQQLLPLLLSGSAGIARLALEARNLGLILSSETLQKAAAANDEFDKIGEALKVAGVNMAAQFLPALRALREVVTDPAFQEGVKSLAKNIGEFVEWMVNNSDTILRVSGALAGMKIGASLGRMGGGAGMAIGAAVGGVTGFLAASQMLKSELESIDKTLQSIGERQSVLAFRIADPNAKAAEVQRAIAELQRLDQQAEQALARRKQLTEEILAKEKEAAKERAPTNVTITKSEFFDPDVNKALEDVAFKTRLARGEFSELADGFPELVNGFQLSRGAIQGFDGDISKLPPQLQDLNEKMKNLAQTMQMRDFGKELGESLGRAFEDAVVSGKSLSEVLKALQQDILRLMLRMLVTKPLMNLFGDLFGSLLGGGGIWKPGAPIGGSALVPSFSTPASAPSLGSMRGGMGGNHTTNIHLPPGTTATSETRREGGDTIEDIHVKMTNAMIARGGADRSLQGRLGARPRLIQR